MITTSLISQRHLRASAINSSLVMTTFIRIPRKTQTGFYFTGQVEPKDIG